MLVGGRVKGMLSPPPPPEIIEERLCPSFLSPSVIGTLGLSMEIDKSTVFSPYLLLKPNPQHIILHNYSLFCAF